MSEAAASSETPLWRFSLHFYRQVGVADACIALQELEAERLQQEALYSRSLSPLLGREAETAAAARANIAAYEQTLTAAFPKPAVHCLLAAFAAIKHDNFAPR